MSTHNICFHGEIRKIPDTPSHLQHMMMSSGLTTRQPMSVTCVNQDYWFQ